MDLSKYFLPKSVKVEGKRYKIKTDFRFFLSMARKLKDPAAKYGDFDFMYIKEIPANRAAGFGALLQFMQPSKELPRVTGGGSGVVVMDYDLDADLIYAAFMQCYNIDLFNTKNLHWWKFTALLNGLTGTRLNDIISYRVWQDKGGDDDYTKSMRKLQEAWRIVTPEEKTAEDEALKRFDDWLAGKRK